MIKIHYIQPCGKQQEAKATEGQSIMQVAIANNIPGIDADCGGACACGTCHVHIAADWLPSFPPASADEIEMLSFAIGATDDSRLACQVKLDASHDGIVVRLPEGQH